jgi:hypothetical protein
MTSAVSVRRHVVSYRKSGPFRTRYAELTCPGRTRSPVVAPGVSSCDIVAGHIRAGYKSVFTRQVICQPAVDSLGCPSAKTRRLRRPKGGIRYIMPHCDVGGDRPKYLHERPDSGRLSGCARTNVHSNRAIREWIYKPCPDHPVLSRSRLRGTNTARARRTVSRFEHRPERSHGSLATRRLFALPPCSALKTLVKLYEDRRPGQASGQRSM